MPTHFDRETILAALAVEEAGLNAALARSSDATLHAASREDGWTAHAIAAHLADATYGLALMIIGEIPVTLPTDPQTGWIDPHEYNEQRRQKNTTLSREKLAERLSGAFAAARRAVAAEQNPEAPGPTAGPFTRADWHQRLLMHIRGHRAEIEAIIEQAT